MKAKKTWGQWTEEGTIKHGGCYLYILPEGGSYDMPFKGTDKLIIKCPIHGIFTQRAGCHCTTGCKCPECSKNAVAISHTKTWLQWTEDGADKHGGKYRYMLPEGGDVNMLFRWNDKLIIQCPIHGIFMQGAGNHCTRGYKCPKCSRNEVAISHTKTWLQWTEEGAAKHGGKYRYMLPEGGDVNMLFGWNDKLIIQCPIHGIFIQAAVNHCTSGCGCPKCGHKKIALSLTKKTWRQWTEEGTIKHGGYYLYILPEGGDVNMLFRWNDKLIIQCPIHGIFTQRAGNHCTRGCKCPKCSRDAASIMISKTWGQWTEEGTIKHGGYYLYILPEGGDVNMLFGWNDKLIIQCPIHGIFMQAAVNHCTSGCGCPKCKSSKGERKVAKHLNLLSLKYIPQFKLDKSRLRYDFKLEDHPILIEYDGEQHYLPNYQIAIFKSKLKGQAAFSAQQKRDRIKDELAAKHGMKLIRIPYWEYDNIEKILTEALAPYASSVQMAVDASAVTQAT